MIVFVVREYNIDIIYNFVVLLFVVVELKLKLVWKIGIDGLWNVFEVVCENKCVVFILSLIGLFGESILYV